MDLGSTPKAGMVSQAFHHSQFDKLVAVSKQQVTVVEGGRVKAYTKKMADLWFMQLDGAHYCILVFCNPHRWPLQSVSCIAYTDLN